MIRDYKSALKWYLLAAEQRDTMALMGLGLMYLRGNGVDQSNTRAHMWYNLATSINYEVGTIDLNTVEATMTPALIEEAQKLARECVAKNYKDC